MARLWGFLWLALPSAPRNALLHTYLYSGCPRGCSQRLCPSMWMPEEHQRVVTLDACLLPPPSPAPRALPPRGPGWFLPVFHLLIQPDWVRMSPRRSIDGLAWKSCISGMTVVESFMFLHRNFNGRNGQNQAIASRILVERFSERRQCPKSRSTTGHE